MVARRLLATTRWPPGSLVRIVSDEEPTAAGLLDAARRSRADLILVGSPEDDDAGDPFTPPEIDLLEHMPCPVILAKVPRVTRILVALEGSPGADALVRLFRRWGAFRDVPVDVVSVAPVTTTASDFVTPWAPTPRAEPQQELGVETHRTAAHDAARRLSALGWQATPSVRVGDPARELVAAAEDLGSDLVAITAHGRSGRQRSHLGSVTHEVLRRARGSVLVMGGGLVEARPGLVAAAPAVAGPSG